MTRYMEMKCKCILKDASYLMMKHFYPDWSGLLQEDNVPSKEHKQRVDTRLSESEDTV